MKIPFLPKYPYTNFEQLNIDWLLEKIGGFDSRITSNTDRITTLEGRTDIIENRLAGHDDDIGDLKQRMTTAEGDIDSLENRMGTAEGTIADHTLDINDLKNRMGTAEGDIVTIKGDIININGQVLNLITECDEIIKLIAPPYDEDTIYSSGMYCWLSDEDNHIKLYRSIHNTSTGPFDPSDWTQTDVATELMALNQSYSVALGQILSLNTRVDGIPIVAANPGGTGTALNTISIDNTVYEITGGGGSGSTVTANPTGTPIADLFALDIDGDIYAIQDSVIANPVSAATDDLEKVQIGSTVYQVAPTIDNTLDDTSDNAIANSAVTTAINNINSDITDLTNAIGSTTNGTASGSQYINYGGFREAGNIDLTPGTYIVIANIALSPIGSGPYATLNDVHADFMACTDMSDISHTMLPIKDSKLFINGIGSTSYSITNVITVAENTTVYFGFTFGSSFGYCGKVNNGIIAVRMK